MAAGSFLFVVRALAGAAAFAWAECAVVVEAVRLPCTRLRDFVCALRGTNSLPVTAPSARRAPELASGQPWFREVWTGALMVV